MIISNTELIRKVFKIELVQILYLTSKNFEVYLQYFAIHDLILMVDQNFVAFIWPYESE